jgi:chromosomal replication initiator protein
MAIKDPKELWRTTLAQIEVKLDSPAEYRTFFSGAQLIDVSKGRAIISVTNPYTSDWLQRRHNELIKDTITHVYGEELKLEFIVQQERPDDSQPIAATPLLSMQNGMHASVMEAVTRSGLNQKYTLNSFIVGDSNRIAHAAAQAVIETPGMAYNPLFLYGHTGVGKTHIAQAIGRSLLERNPAKKVMYITSEGFLNELVRAIKSNRTHEMRARYRDINILIIDDIQLISQWVTTQVEVFNTFNELHNNNNQIVLISDRRPEEIKDLQDRLRSRFQGGMVVEIAQPDYELRLAILERKATSANLEVSPRILEVIARHVSDNIRELEGALQKVALFNQMKTTGELSTEEVLSIIGADHKTKREKVKVPSIMKAVAKTFAVTVKDLKGPRRTAELALARQVCMFLLREEFGYKLEDIAYFLGRSDHTTVMHAVDKIRTKMLTTEGFKQQVVGVIRQLQEMPADELS